MNPRPATDLLIDKMSKPIQFRASLTQPIPDIDSFSCVLIIPQPEANGSIKGIWASISWAEMEVNQRTLKIVTRDALDLIASFASYVPKPNPMPEQILISDSPLTYLQATSLLDIFEYRDGTFTRTLNSLHALDLLLLGNDNIYRRYLAELYAHLTRVTDDWLYDANQRILSVLNQTFDSPFIAQTKLLSVIVDQPLPSSEAKLKIGYKIYQFLESRDPQLALEFSRRVIHSAELAPLIGTFGFSLPKAINLLSYDECRTVLTTSRKIDVNEMFVFDITDLITVENTDQRISQYLGFPVDALDLSNCCLTGSIIPYVYGKKQEEYSITQTTLITNEDNWIRSARRLRMNPIVGSLTTVTEKDGFIDVQVEDELSRFEIQASPHQIQICVLDPVIFSDVINDIYETVSKYYPRAKLQRIHANEYLITNAHRDISINADSPRDISRQSISVTRGWITEEDEDRVTYASISCIASLTEGKLLSYYVFSPEDQVIADQLFTWRQLGYEYSPQLLESLFAYDLSLEAKIKLNSLMINLTEFNDHSFDNLNVSYNVKGMLSNLGVYDVVTGIAELNRRT
jgi:hypothetical protein